MWVVTVWLHCHSSCMRGGIRWETLGPCLENGYQLKCVSREGGGEMSPSDAPLADVLSTQCSLPHPRARPPHRRLKVRRGGRSARWTLRS
jgi:hypothetical protein